MIFDISQTALDLNFDGLMIESHWDPDNAWSDAKQQVTPSRLIEIMRDLKVRNKTTEEEAYKNKLGSLRAQIDVADQTLLDALGKRMKIAKEIGLLKKDNSQSGSAFRPSEFRFGGPYSGGPIWLTSCPPRFSIK